MSGRSWSRWKRRRKAPDERFFSSKTLHRRRHRPTRRRSSVVRREIITGHSRQTSGPGQRSAAAVRPRPPSSAPSSTFSTTNRRRDLAKKRSLFTPIARRLSWIRTPCCLALLPWQRTMDLVCTRTNCAGLTDCSPPRKFTITKVGIVCSSWPVGLLYSESYD